ncbi:MAG: response regulator [Oscillospiraceae bacterium]|nr:response regulator [Oscillospiraceae bacterium]
MRKILTVFRKVFERFWYGLNLGIRTKLLIVFLLVKIAPLIVIAAIAWYQFNVLGEELRAISGADSTNALNASAVENIERMSTDTALRVADFLYERDDDIRYVANLAGAFEGDVQLVRDAFSQFVRGKTRRLVKSGQWALAEDGGSWTPVNTPDMSHTLGQSTNPQNDTERDGSAFHPRPADGYEYENVPVYDEITFVGLNGVELVKVGTADMPGSRKVNYAGWFKTDDTKDISVRANTFVRAETYWQELDSLTSQRGSDIYVSDVTGAYVGSNYIGMYTPKNVDAASVERGYAIEYDPEGQSYAGAENPNGKRFEGIVRWASPVFAGGEKIGYVTLALDHDQIMEFVDHQTPVNERYTELPSAYEGNYAFIWDYQCRSICHPRHNSIVGYDPVTGDPEIPWVETEIYGELLERSGLDAERAAELTARERFAVLKGNWPNIINSSPTYELIRGLAVFNDQKRPPDKTAASDLTQLGYVGLDGRYLNNAPQCTGWMDLTAHGGSGSFYILWSGIWKLNTAAAIPYYTGRYAPSEDNGFSRRGFGFVAIGAGLDDFTAPARATVERLEDATRENLTTTTIQLVVTTGIILTLVVLMAVWLASFITGNITYLIHGISRFRAGERQFRFKQSVKDEFGTLADSFDDMADSIVGSVRSPLSIVDMDMNIIYMNEYSLEIIGCTLDTVVGKPYRDYSIYPSGTVYCPITALLENRDAATLHIVKTGKYIQGAANYLYNSAGEKAGYIVSSADVTDMVNKQIELELAIEAANAANEHKGEFLARMSHEIRTPMNAVIGVTNIVRSELDSLTAESGYTSWTEDIRNHLSQIESSSQHLLGLLNDILDISKIEAGKIDLSDEGTDLKKLVETVADIIRPRCEEKNIRFITQFDDFRPSAFKCDSLRLRQVLINLLGNAVKFTPELGRIDFCALEIWRTESRARFKFAVRDTGIGIPQETISTIFQPFEQADKGITRKYGGTGLGLAISSRIVELFGGEIEVKSTPGEGSEFSFEIELETSHDSGGEDIEFNDPTGRFAGKRALLVDDVEINREIVKFMLAQTGIELDEAGDGAAAVGLFKESPLYGYDVIFMDIRMPGMDGYDAARAIRALPRDDAATVPIVALTANAFKDDIDRAMSAGMNAHVSKPVEMEALTEALFKFVLHNKL